MLESQLHDSGFDALEPARDSDGIQPNVIRASGHDGNLLIPDAHLLFTADFSRLSHDLVLTGDDGKQTIVQDYFSNASKLDLVSPNGALLNFDTVRILAGPLAPGQYAQVSSPTTGVAIGKVITGEATANHLDGSSSAVQVGDTLYQGDVLITGISSGVGVVFTDNTVFSLSADSRMVLNELVFQDGGSDNSMLFTLVQGTFSFVAGKVAPSGEMKIDTPVATMGIRGTTGLTQIAATDGATIFRILEDPGTGRVGAYDLLSKCFVPETNCVPGTVLAVVNSTGTQYVLSSATSIPTAEPVQAGGDEQDIINNIYSTAVRAGLIKADLGGTEGNRTERAAADNTAASQETIVAALLNLDASSISVLDSGLALMSLSEEAGTGDSEGQTVAELSSSEPIAAQQVAPDQTSDSPIIVINPPDSGNPPDTGANQPPSTPVVVIGGGVAEDSGALIITADQLLAGATDPEGQALSIVSVSVPVAEGTISSNPDGTFTFSPETNFAGTATITIQVSDGTNIVTSTALLDVVSVPDSPVITSDDGGPTAALPRPENVTAVTTVTATDPDAGAELSFSIIGADAALFAIDDVTGVLSFLAAPNFEVPGDADGDNVYDVQVTVSDGALTDTQSIAVTVTNQNEAPVITSDGGGPTAALPRPENVTAVTTVTATDPDAGAELSFSIIGADAALFAIDDVTGVLSFLAAPNFEVPGDADGDNVYDVQVTVSDGALTDTQSIAVTVTNQNEAPVITSDGGGPTAALPRPENVTAVTTVTATDPDAGAELSFSIIGADAALFAIDDVTGVLSFVSAPDFEAPTDAGANNVYDVQVQVSDGTNTDTQDIAVTVTDVAEAANPFTSTGDTKLGGTSIHRVIDPSRTYLRTNGDAALGAIAIDLLALGIAAGDVVLLEQTGAYDPDGPGPALDNSANGMTAVFSASATLAASGNLNRVTGAVAATDPVFGGQLPAVVTLNTLNDGIATDIAQDFEVFGTSSGDLTVTSVPAGAGFLFVSPFDQFFEDNTDLDGDFGINIYRPMVVGVAGDGTLTMTGGAEYRDEVVAGAAAGSNGTITIESAAVLNIGGNPTPDPLDGAYTVNGAFIVGLAGTGTATISGGSVVTATANGTYSNVQIGEYAGADGTVTVTGAGSKLISQGIDNGMYVGREGTGTLNVLAGGFVQTLGLSVARYGTGTVNVNGVGSHLVVSNEGGGYSQYAGQAGHASFGARAVGASGTLNVTAGGVFDVVSAGPEENPQLRFGRNIGSIGVGVVDGAGSQINITQAAPAGGYYGGPRLLVGLQGYGTLTVRNGGAVNLTGEDATLLVSAAGNVDGIPPSALLPQSELIIQTGGIVTVDHQGYGYDTINVGNNQFGNGAIRISGVGSKLVSEGVRDEIIIGNRGIGILTVGVGGAGAEVLGQRMFVGNDLGGVGTVTVDGLNSKITLSSPMIFDPVEDIAGLWVGNRGNGTLTVSNQATVDISGARAALFVGDGYNAVDPGSVGVLNILSGGVVTVDHGTDDTAGYSTVHIGTQELGVGTVNVIGAGSKLVSIGDRDEIHVGNYGFGTLNVTAGGEVQGQLMFVGTNETATGFLTVSGDASKLTLTGTAVSSVNSDIFLSVGNRGNGIMTVEDNASVTLTGAGAHLFVGDGYGLLAGPGGTGTLLIQSGGDVTVNNTDPVIQGAITIGANQFGDGIVTVTGVGSTLTAAGNDPDIQVGNYGTGVLNVQAGGTVAALFMTVGNHNGSYGLLNITNAGNITDAVSKVILSNDTHTAGIYGDKYAGSINVGFDNGSYGRMNITAGGVLELRNTDNENDPVLNIGNRQGSIGVVTVDGVGSAVNIAQVGGYGGPVGLYRGGPFVQVGRYGDGTLTVSNGAQINMAGEYGTFRVSRGNTDGVVGAPARVALSEAFILSGADVTMNMTGGTHYGAYAVVANRTNANGRLTIDGSGSTLTVHGDNIGNLDAETSGLHVASHGLGEVIISNGADVIINGGNDQRPILAVGEGRNSLGTLMISGVGSTINLLTTNTDPGGGGYIAVGRFSGSTGTMSITDGAQVINDFESGNSVMTVGRSGIYGGDPASIGHVTVDGNGNTATLLDAGQLLVIGADWNPNGGTTDVANVGFNYGGTGSVTVLNGATVRANEIAVGQGGTIGGNATFDGNVTVDGGGTITTGASPGILTITGNLNLVQGTLAMQIDGLTAGTTYVPVSASGAVTVGDVDVNLATAPAFNFADGNRLILIDGQSTLDVTDWSLVNVNVTDEPASLGYQIADEGDDLVFEALNNGTTDPAIVSFGAASNIAAVASIANGIGTGTGGRFDSVSFVNATGVEGTSAGDTFSVGGTSLPKIDGGLGQDHLDLTGDGFLIDSASILNITGIELLDISGSGDINLSNTLSLTVSDVVNIGEGNSAFTAGSPTSESLVVDANGGDSVFLTGGWVLTSTQVNLDGLPDGQYNIYESSNAEVLAKIAVDFDATIEFA